MWATVVEGTIIATIIATINCIISKWTGLWKKTRDTRYIVILAEQQGG